MYDLRLKGFRPLLLHKTLFLPLFVFFLGHKCSVFAQEFTLQGRLITHEETPLEFAKVNVFQNDSILVIGTMTDSLGAFSIHVQQGNYTLQVELFGVEQWKQFMEITTDTDLGSVEIDVNKTLNEVTVSDAKPLWIRKADRLIFNVENSISASSGTLLQALKVTPGVVVRQNAIHLQGKTSVSIMMEDHIVQLSGEALITYLESIPADDIQSIEVITTPPAKYEAEGKSGLINIRYKKARRNAWKNNAGFAYDQGYYATYMPTDHFTYNKNKFSADFNFFANIGNSGIREEGQIDFPSQEVWKEYTWGKNTNQYISSDLKASYQLNDKHTIGTIFSFIHYQPKPMKQTINTDIIRKDILVEKIHTLSEQLYHVNMATANLNYIYKMNDKNQFLSVDVDYFSSPSTQGSFYTTRQTNMNNVLLLHHAYQTKGTVNTDNYAAKIDMNHPIEWATFRYGSKISSSKANAQSTAFNHSSGIPKEDSTKRNNFLYTETVFALYTDINKQIGEKWEATVGLRYELTQTKGVAINKNETTHRQYGQLFPTAYLMYKINENKTISLEYSKRTNRPAFWQLDPTDLYYSPYVTGRGNSMLRPAYNDNIGLSWNTGSFYVNLYSMITTQGFAEGYHIDSITKISSIKVENFYTQYFYGVQINYALQPCSWMENNVSAYTYYNETKITHPDYRDLKAQKGFVGALTLNNTIYFNKKQTISTDFDYNLISLEKALTQATEAYHKLDVFFRFQLFDKNLRLVIGVYDVFLSGVPRYIIETNGIRTINRQDMSSRTFYASIRYTLGNKTIKEIERETSNQDEKNRISK